MLHASMCKRGSWLVVRRRKGRWSTFQTSFSCLHELLARGLTQVCLELHSLLLRSRCGVSSLAKLAAHIF